MLVYFNRASSSLKYSNPTTIKNILIKKPGGRDCVQVSLSPLSLRIIFAQL